MKIFLLIWFALFVYGIYSYSLPKHYYLVYIGVWNASEARKLQSELRERGFTVEIEERDWDNTKQ
jgi:hypothetical protein